MNLETLPQLLTVKDFSRKFSISVPIIYKLLMKGELEARKIGGKTVIDCEEAMRWKSNLPQSKHESINVKKSLKRKIGKKILQKIRLIL